MLPDLESTTETETVRDNLLAVQAIYFADQLEQLRVFQVGERIAQLFQQGLLPLGAGTAADLSLWHASTAERLTAQERAQLFARALGAPGGEAAEIEPNREFNSLWLRFVASVALLARQRDVPALLVPPLPGVETTWRAARALAVNASSHGTAWVQAAAQRLAAEVEALLAMLGTPEVMQAFGARDMWQVIDQVNRNDLGGAVNVARHRMRAQAGKVVLQWLAARADALCGSEAPATDIAPSDADLLNAVEQWLSVSGVQDSTAETGAQPNEPADPAPPPIDLPAIARELLQALGPAVVGSASGAPGRQDELTCSSGVAALFCGEPGTGKSLAAHALAAALSRDLLRVDLRQVVGESIGETERNLDAVFAHAEQAGALLLLDEADALFGTRSEVKDAHDRYANVELGHLLQRIEAHGGVVVLESHLLPTPTGAAEDAACGRKLQVVRFPRPRPVAHE